jgi:hypothetical protein
VPGYAWSPADDRAYATLPPSTQGVATHHPVRWKGRSLRPSTASLIVRPRLRSTLGSVWNECPTRRSPQTGGCLSGLGPGRRRLTPISSAWDIGAVPIAPMLATLTDRRDFGADWLVASLIVSAASRAKTRTRCDSSRARPRTSPRPTPRSGLPWQESGIGAFCSMARCRVRRRANVVQSASAALGVRNPSTNRVAAYPDSRKHRRSAR